MVGRGSLLGNVSADFTCCLEVLTAPALSGQEYGDKIESTRSTERSVMSDGSVVASFTQEPLSYNRLLVRSGVVPVGIYDKHILYTGRTLGASSVLLTSYRVLLEAHGYKTNVTKL